MQRSDPPLVTQEDLALALQSLTVLPVPAGTDEQKALRAVWAWPLAGLIVALPSALAGVLVTWSGLSAGLAAAAVLAMLAALTGARHEDELIRLMHSLSGRPARRGASGSAAIVTICLLTLARWSALVTLIFGQDGVLPVLAAALLSRAAMPLMMLALPPAGGRYAALRPDAETPQRASAALGLALALALALLCLGWALIPAVAAGGVVAVLLGLLARARIGGRSPDLPGAAQPLTELAVLAALAAAY